jgi:hypothetical protein
LPASTFEPHEQPSSDHVLLRNGSSTQYVSESLLSRVLEEACETKFHRFVVRVIAG